MLICYHAHMMKHYANYIWKKGIPYGLQEVADTYPKSYKILSDPYHKWISIESYHQGNFASVVYDSHIFDFRSLSLTNQTAWVKETLEESPESMLCLIKDQNDRVVLFENYRFENGRCLECVTTSAHQLAISSQKIYYTALGDPFNGVTLFDANDHIVMQKTYAIDEKTGEFTDLLEEKWDGKNCLLPDSKKFSNS
jgi:hypothetical protein